MSHHTFSNPYDIGSDETFTDRARKIVRDHYIRETGLELELKDVRIVWASKTLQNWKAMVITLTGDDLYYEVTHNGLKMETYLDTYEKKSNVVIKD